MALKCDLNLIVLCTIVLSGYIAADLPSPRIDSEFETIIEANDNYTVFCMGTKPVMWTIPTITKGINEFWTTFKIDSERPTNPAYQYGSRLTIYNMTYRYIGFYYCHHDDANTTDFGSASIYLFVNDEENLTNLGVNDELETVTVTKYEEAIIPCTPTAPDVKVTLSSMTEGEIEDASFDPKTGFSLHVSDLSQEGIYICAFSRNNFTFEVFVNLIIESSSPISHLPKPFLEDLNRGHTNVGDDLTLKCNVRTPNYAVFNWITPTGPLDTSRTSVTTYRIREERMIQQILTIHNATLEDKGNYTCKVEDLQKHVSAAELNVKIYDVSYCDLNLLEPNGVYQIVTSPGEKSVQWNIDVHGHPVPRITWLNNQNDTIQMGIGNKYETSFNHSRSAFLKIKNINIKDFGYYTLVANNNCTEKTLNLFLNVTDKPTVHIENSPFILINKPSKIKCFAYAYPPPTFEWMYKSCQTEDCQFEVVKGRLLKKDGLEFISEITINAVDSGIVKCLAKNYKGTDEAIETLFVTDIVNGFDIFDFDKTINVNDAKNVAKVGFGEKIAVTCGASKNNYSEPNWIFNNQILTNDEKHILTKSFTKYSNKLELVIPNPDYSDSGLYRCRVAGSTGEYLYKNVSFDLTDPIKPNILNSNIFEEEDMILPQRLVMTCKALGLPKPSITWYKNGVVFTPAEDDRIHIHESREKIIFSKTDANDEGIYTCEARNKLGVVYTDQTLKFKNNPQLPKWLIYVIVLLGVLFLGVTVLFVIKIRKERQLRRELKSLGLANFVKGAVESINPELGLDDQAELLPYDQKFEFPIEQLKLGKQLGSGAFGVVMKGEAKNIVQGEPITTVAVKMVKKTTDHTHIRALASELKIMVHLGKHLNVVNLLGACTKNVAKRELLVIVEFCRFGNLQNYLLRHRSNYIDQVDPSTGKIDYTIGQDFLDRSYSVSSNRSDQKSPSLKYAALTFSNSSGNSALSPQNYMGDYRANTYTGASATTDMTTMTQDDGVILSNNSVQPDWRSNYKGDYKGNVKPICTNDLLAWAFQVSRGMDYLASRKVLHGDLAARNILLSDNNIVKICDFGLAKNMYKDDNYKKKGNGPLPVKWMAIESIRDRIFSTQSDVWSFGIVLWEFFSLAETPYPGMEADERLYQKLIDGYRMESPKLAPKEIYKMMTDCWALKPLARPSFTRLSERIGSLLEASLRKHYIDLNDPYLVMNTKRLEEGQSDYLAMLSPPTFESLSTPHYVNEMAGQESMETPGYLSMKPSTIFSPRVEPGQVFDFNVSNKKLSSVDGTGQELLPMLSRQSDSDSETPVQSPSSPKSYSNPSYHIPPKIIEESDNDIIKSKDNYVNMPKNKSLVKDKSGLVNNPFTDVNSEKSDVHYVNSNVRDWESTTA